MGKRNNFTGYAILLHKLPVVAILFTNNELTIPIPYFTTDREVGIVFVQKILHTVVHVLELQSFYVVKYGINLVK